MAGRPQSQAKNIESKQLYLIDKQVNEQRGTTTIIRVVDWISNGKHYPQLEKREFFVDGETGDLKMGKAKGFTRKDLELVQDHWGEIMSALGSKLPEDQRKPGPAAQPAQPTPAARASAPVEQDF